MAKFNTIQAAYYALQCMQFHQVSHMFRRFFNQSSRFKSIIDSRIESSEPPYVQFGVFGIINYPSFYWIWLESGHGIDASMTLRLIASVLSFCLLLSHFWPKRLKPLLPMFWYFSLWLCIPYLVSYMIFNNNVTDVVLMNGMLGIFLLVLLVVDWTAFVIILVLGIFAGWLTHTVSSGPVIVETTHLTAVVTSYCLAVVIGVVFSGNYRRMQENISLKNRIKAMQLVGASIAHELRTPLTTIRAGIKGYEKYLPQLIDAYEQAKNAGLPVDDIRVRHLSQLSKIHKQIEDETIGAGTIIDMLLVKINDNANQHFSKEELAVCSVNTCLEYALARYPFKEPQSSDIVHWRKSPESDFQFHGSQLFFTHILFNLLKNALYYITKARKGHIEIWTESRRKMNVLHIKDTGHGIPDDCMPYIFDRFYSDTENGAGVGLAFCKMAMESMGGKITCESRLGEYAHFSLFFPKLIEPKWEDSASEIQKSAY